MACSHIQAGATTWNFGTGNVKSVTLIGVASGDMLLVGVGWGNTQVISSVQDDFSTNLTLVESLSGSDSNGTVSVYYLNSATAGDRTVTVTFAGETNGGGIVVHEVAGQATSSPVDKHVISDQFTPGTGTDAITSGSQTTTGDGEYIFGFCHERQLGSNTIVAGTGFTSDFSGDNRRNSEHIIQTSAGSIAATFTDATNGGTGRYLTALTTIFANTAAPDFMGRAQAEIFRLRGYRGY